MSSAVRQSWASLRKCWDRWKLTAVFLALFGLAIFTHEVDVKHNADTCASVTQVKNATDKLTKPTSVAGVTDQNTLDRIRAGNEAKAEARRELDAGLACK